MKRAKLKFCKHNKKGHHISAGNRGYDIAHITAASVSVNLPQCCNNIQQ